MRQGGRHADSPQAAVKPVQVLAQAERTRAVHRHDFVNRIAKKKGTIERRHRGLPERQVGAVQVADGQRAAQANHRRMVSMRRRHHPPAATGFSGCSATVASTWVPLSTRKAPRFASTMAPRCWQRSEEHTSELQSPDHLVCRLLLEKKNNDHRSVMQDANKTDASARNVRDHICQLDDTNQSRKCTVRNNRLGELTTQETRHGTSALI